MWTAGQVRLPTLLQAQRPGTEWQQWLEGEARRPLLHCVGSRSGCCMVGIS